MILRLALVLAVTVGLGACQSSPDGVAAAGEGTYLNLGPEATYVGIETCGSCHRETYETYTQSEMGRSFRQATLANSDANFEDPEPIYNPASDLYYLPFHRGEALFVMEFRLSGRDTTYKRVEQIDYIIGSGHHTNSHMREENGYVYQVPVTWYVQEARWDLAPGFHGAGGKRFSRPIPEGCMTCHNAMPGFVEGSENRFDHIPLGIDCERCHGPGSIHVEQKRAGKIVDVSQEIDYSIVNPAKLPPDLQLNVCERCHMQGTEVYREGKGPADYRPGMRLADIENVFEVRDADSVTVFRMASHPDRLRMSACFQATREAGSTFEALTCITCHNPHVEVKTVDYNASCRSCHAPAPLAAAMPTPNLRQQHAAATSDCVSCHMPDSDTWDIPHVTITDHFIRVPEGAPGEWGKKARQGPALSAAEVEARRRIIRLASLIEEHPSDREVAEGFMAYHEEVSNRPGMLDSAAVRLDRARAQVPLQRLAPSLIRLRFLQGDYAGVRTLARQIAPGALDAWTLYRTGESYNKLGEAEAATRYLGQAVALAPYHLRFRHRLGSAYADAGQLQKALAAYATILTEDATFEDAYNDRGFVHLQLGDLAAAEADFVAALGLNPNAEMPLANLASLYFNTGRRAEARAYAERLVRLVPDEPRYRQLLEAVTAAGP